MDPLQHLLFHNIGTIISGLVSFGMAIFIYLNGPRKSANILMALAICSVGFFYVFHFFGTNVFDHRLSRDILMGNMSIVFAVAFLIHAVFIIIGKYREQRVFVWTVYISALITTVFFIFNPDFFLLDSVPKMYFPNYYVPGVFDLATRAVFINGFVPFYLFFVLVKTYVETTNAQERVRLIYFILSCLLAFFFGLFPVFLIFNIQIDPLIGIWFGPLWVIPMVYAILTYNVVDIRIVAKRAFLYTAFIFLIALFIGIFDFVDTYANSYLPSVTIWLLPFIPSLIIMLVGLFIWRKLREADIMKYEFITTVTHKFRTPLTQIKWAAENLVSGMSPEDLRTQIGYIQTADAKLVELTSLLMNVSESDTNQFQYHMERGDVSKMAEEIIASSQNQLQIQNLVITKDLAPETFAIFDQTRIKFVIQMLIENAMNYSADESPTIHIQVRKNGTDIQFSITDNGIGINKDDLQQLFGKFYRGHQARLANTEGMGIGLYLTKEIITRHNGRIWVESEGAGKGSTFKFTLPKA